VSDKLRTQLTNKLTAVLDDIKGDLGELWQVEVREAVEDAADLTLLKLTLTDPLELAAVDRELLHAKARVENWTFTGADLVRAKLKIAFHEVAEVLGSVLKGFIH
jgi:hypothetical protein